MEAPQSPSLEWGTCHLSLLLGEDKGNLFTAVKAEGVCSGNPQTDGDQGT